MLHLETVNNPLLEVATALFNIPSLADFRLVGGTALALHLGHRKSIDIDLFSTGSLNLTELIKSIHERYPAAVIDNDFEEHITTIINGVKVDICPEWHNPFTESALVQNGLRVATVYDVALMKINAIIDRRAKKDYIDLFFIFNKINPVQLLCDFKKVVPLMSDKSTLFALGESAIAFENQSPMPKMLLPFKVDELIEKMNNTQAEYLKVVNQKRSAKKPSKGFGIGF